MNAALVERWNGLVRPRDRVWVLGDVALTPKALGPVAQLNGRKVLVAGNHDACWVRHKHHTRQGAVYRDAGFAGVVDSGVVNAHRLRSGIVVRMSHLPYTGDSHGEDRYAEWRPVDDGLPLICGHVHDAWKTMGRQLNVGVDVWNFQPVPEELVRMEIEAMYRMG